MILSTPADEVLPRHQGTFVDTGRWPRRSSRRTRARTTHRLRPASAAGDAILQVAIVCLLFVAVLAYGGATLGARTTVNAAALALAAVLLVHVAWQGSTPVYGLRLALPLVVLLVVGSLQLVPLPAVIRAPLGAAPEQGLRVPLVPDWLPLSFNPGGTVAALSCLLSVSIVFVVSLTITSRASARRLATLLVSMGGMVAAGAVVAFVEPNSVFPPVSAVSPDRARGPFVNPDHFANWLAALLPLSLAGLLENTHGRSRRFDGYLLACAAALPFMATAMGLTFSRGGLLAAACGLAYFTIGLVRERHARRLLSAAVVISLVAAYAAWAGGTTLGARFFALWHDPLGDNRIPIWQAAWQAVWSTPVLGSGLGTFLEAARPHVSVTVPTRIAIDYAHNEPLQLAVEAGLVGIAIVAGGLILWLRQVHLMGTHSDSASSISRAAAAGVIALLAGSLFDFAVRLPANALLGAVLAALAIAAQRRPDASMVMRIGGRLAVLGATALLLAAIPSTLRPYRAAELAGPLGSVGDVDSGSIVDRLRRASSLQPRDARYADALARVLGDASARAWRDNLDLHGERFPNHAARARAAQALAVGSINAQLDAIAGDRINPAYRQSLGWLFTNLAALEEAAGVISFVPDAHLDRIPIEIEPSTAALGLYQDAVALEPRNAALHQALADWALQHLVIDPTHSSLLGAGAAPLERIAVTAARQAVKLDPPRLGSVARTALARGAGYTDLRQLVPDDPQTLWQLAAVLESEKRFAWTDELVGALVADSPAVLPAASEDLAERIAGRANTVSAQAVLRQMAAVPRTPPRILAALGRVEWAAGALPDAQTHFTAALAATPDAAAQAQLERDLGLVLIERGDLDGAQAHFDALLRARPHDPWVHFGLGTVADQRRDWRVASRAYERAALLGTDDDDLYYRLGHRYFARDLWRQAARVWESGLRVNPSSEPLHLWLARAYAATGERDAAVEHYRAVLRTPTTSSAAQHELDALLRGTPG